MRSLALCAHRNYAKALSRFLYVPFTSNHPRTQLKSWMKAEVLRIVKNTSSKEYFFVRLNDS
jgi:hypothetical protein